MQIRILGAAASTTFLSIVNMHGATEPALPGPDISPAPAGITIKPLADNALLINPGKGWVEYWGPSVYTNEFISVEYNRTNWSALEPAEGRYNWGGFDGVINDFAVKYGKKCAIGTISTNCGQAYSTPKWVFDAGAVPLKIPAAYLPEGYWVVPKTWDDPVYLAKMRQFIAAFGAHFNGNPNLAFVDIRSYGDCGEGNGSFPGFTVNTSQANLRDNCYAPYVKAFPNTRLIVPWTAAWFDGKPADDIYAWLASQGVGMRRDGICSTWSKDGSECLIAYPHAPAVMEYALTWPDTVAAGTDKNTGLRYDSPEELLMYVVKGKASYMQWHPEFYEQNKEFCRMLGNKMGYHFVLQQADFPRSIKAGVPFELGLKWLNDGVAPLYEPCRVAVALLDEDNNVVEQQWLAGSIPGTWLPDTSTTETFKICFTQVPAVVSKLALGLFLYPHDEHPAYRLGIQGRVNNGWYVLSGTADQVPAIWSNQSGACWNDGPWTGNRNHNGVDVIADFSRLDMTRDAMVTLDGPVTAGNLLFGDKNPSHNWTLDGGKHGSLMLRVSAGMPGIHVMNQTATIGATLVSQLGLVKSGPGTLVLSGSNELNGDVRITGGVLEIAATTSLYAKWQGSTVTVGAGGTLRVNGWGAYGGSGGGDLNQIPLDNPSCLVLDGGTLEFTGASGGNGVRAFRIGAAGATLRNSSKQQWVLATSAMAGCATLDNPSSLTLDGSGANGRLDKAVIGAGSLNKTGLGTWILTASNTYTGATSVRQGNLQVLGALAADSAVTVEPAATLGGTGTIHGPLIVKGTLAPGTETPGTLTVGNKLTLTGTTTLRLGKAGATCLNDRVSGMARVIYGGTFEVSMTGDATLTAGDSFTLFVSDARTGEFSHIVLPSLNAGLQWDITGLASTGIIKVVRSPAPAASQRPSPPASKP